MSFLRIKKLSKVFYVESFRDRFKPFQADFNELSESGQESYPFTKLDSHHP